VVLYAFCSSQDQSEQTASDLVATLLKQVIQNRTAISDNVKSFYKNHHDLKTNPTIGQFTKALDIEIGTYKKVFIVIDALDECAEDRGTGAYFLKALRSLTGNINLLVTSRDLPTIARHFQGTKRLDIRAHDWDMRLFLEYRVSISPRRHLGLLRETIVKDLTQNAQGV
jgi:hypothetical protein